MTLGTKSLDRKSVEELALRLKISGKSPIRRYVELAERISFADEAIILGGSLAFGLGNRKSDIDILLLDSTSGGRPPGPFQFFESGDRVEITRVRTGELASLADDIASSLGRSAPLTLPYTKIRELSRAAFGCHVAGPALDGAVDARLRRTCQEAMLTSSTASAGRHALVALLAAEQDDLATACWNARGATDAALQWMLLKAGHPYAGSKWLYEQARSKPGLAGAWEVVRPCLRIPRDRAGQREHLARCLDVFERTFSTEPVLGVLGADAGWQRGALELCRLAGRHVVVDPESSTVTEIDAGTVPGLRRLFGLAPGEALPVSSSDPSERAAIWPLYASGLVRLDPGRTAS
ncbi:hypothetical protein FM076_30360 [Streptomyces albus subsp. chlorinus]|uniref:hypothetical protein n=1 Tax=Streptomyces albus TaxID=1888 RepID=UPI0015702327|nr:hypothetical protein [Streptomyces albus]NSC25222.1 hypothetical protein [Streptomyces albus subsp. chlorinus]